MIVLIPSKPVVFIWPLLSAMTLSPVGFLYFRH